MRPLPSPVLVAAGGAAGAAVRWGVVDALPEPAAMPWPVLAVNLVGCALLGVLLARRPGDDLRLLAGVGFCGGLTTFSTFTVETAAFLRADRPSTAVAYIAFSVAGGLAAFLVGRTLSRTGP